MVHDSRDLQIKLIDLFVDYTDLDAGVEWSRFYNLEDFEIPEQIKLRHQQILNCDTTSRFTCIKPSSWSDKQTTDGIYKPTVTSSDIVYIELDSDVDSFLDRLEVCAFTIFAKIFVVFLFSVLVVKLVHIYHLLVSIVKHLWIQHNEHLVLR